MSFILNALRKSEQERQARLAATDRILSPEPPPSNNKLLKLSAILVTLNLLFIAGIVWLLRDNPTPLAEPATQAPPKPQPVAQSQPETKKLPAAAAKKAPPSTTSIAELIETETPPALKPAGENKPAAPAKAPQAPQPSAPPVAKQANAPTAPPYPLVQPETRVTKEYIPFLTDLPSEFRQTVPTFTINAFAYSKQADESFVIVDMKKYKPGQMLKDTLLLKEILIDSMVVVYQKQTFRIKRP